ncbi:MAG: iron-sulfur cluster assembly scaffold protein [Spirochaetes bacterium]|nr:iron-sulfur cluster assembly scaffold protein [Spirochaetota bacterium]
MSPAMVNSGGGNAGGEGEGRPENLGRMNDPDASAYIKGLCGDTMEMYLIIRQGRVMESMFYTDGCESSTAFGSAVARLASGRTLQEVLCISPAAALDALGNNPRLESHCAILAVMTLYKAVADYLLRCERT